jgi:XTP/dITP diphosphohydrolase
MEPAAELLAVMRQLRAECDWKAAQTHRSLARYLLEETHETLDAIDTGDATGDWSHLREELGDLLLQVYFHAVVAEQAGAFDFDDVAADIVAKLRRRNPHVFGSATATGPVAVNELWEQVKAAEKPRGSVTDGLPPGLPALLYADKVLARLARSSDGVSEVDREADDLGGRLLALVAEAHADGIDPEQALRDAVRRLLEDRRSAPRLPAGHPDQAL